jgi:hypothetical protein
MGLNSKQGNNMLIIAFITLCFCCYIPYIECFLIPLQHHQKHKKLQHLSIFTKRSTIQQFVSTSPSFSSSPSSSSPGNNRNNNQNASNTNRANWKRNPSHLNNNNNHNSVRIKKQKWKKHNYDQRKSSSSSSSSSSPMEIEKRLQNAKHVEERLYKALDDTRDLIIRSKSRSNAATTTTNVISFPSVRECNSALAIMGDTDDFKRALRLFGKMRESQMLVSQYNTIHENIDDHHDRGISDRIYLFPPSPTLVTYSTLMSRAVSLGKERVALRLWRLMVLQKQFFTNIKDYSSDGTLSSSIHDNKKSNHNKKNMDVDVNTSAFFGAPIVPDIKAVNILMNAFAKMGDHESAKLLMEQIYNGKVQQYDPSEYYNNDSSNHDQYKGPELVSKSNDLRMQEVEYLIRVVPRMKANIVTYNTLIDACHRAGDLDAGELHP